MLIKTNYMFKIVNIKFIRVLFLHQLQSVRYFTSNFYGHIFMYLRTHMLIHYIL